MPEIQFYVLREGQFLTLTVEFIDQFQKIGEVLCGVLFAGQEQATCAELYLQDLGDLLAGFVQQDVLLVTAEVELFVDFETQHQEDVPETAFPELLLGHAIEPHHRFDVPRTVHRPLAFQLQNLIDKHHPATHSEQLNRVVVLLYLLIQLVVLHEGGKVRFDDVEELLGEMAGELFLEEGTEVFLQVYADCAGEEVRG